MNRIFIFLILTSLATQSFALENNFNYSSLIKELKACRKTLAGCTTEQELEIASFNGAVLNSYDLNTHLARDTQKSIFIPLSLDNSELLTLAAATSLGVVAFKNDQEIMNVIQSNKSDVKDTIASIGNFLGTGKAGTAIAAGSYFMGVYFENNTLKKAGIFIIGSNMATGIVTLATKAAFGRARPISDVGPYSFFKSGDKSFYSGHTAQAFSVATVISEIYKEDYPIVPYVAYGIAAITGYARMYDNVHWASDVIIGAVAGHLITKLAMNLIENNKDGRSGFEIYPGIDPNNGNFMIFLEWKDKQPIIPLKCKKMPDGQIKSEACLAEAFEKAKKRK